MRAWLTQFDPTESFWDYFAQFKSKLYNWFESIYIYLFKSNNIKEREGKTRNEKTFLIYVKHHHLRINYNIYG